MSKAEDHLLTHSRPVYSVVEKKMKMPQINQLFQFLFGLQMETQDMLRMKTQPNQKTKNIKDKTIQPRVENNIYTYFFYIKYNLIIFYLYET